MRGDYLVIAWHPRDALAVHTSRRIEAMLLRQPLMEITRANGLMIAAEETGVTEVAPSMFLVGEIFGNAHHQPPPRPHGNDEGGFQDYCRRLLASHWGSYIALRHDAHAPASLSIFAEPIGSREHAYWRHGGVTMVATDADRWLDMFPPAGLGLNLDEIAHIIHQPGQAAETAPLCGIGALEPGAITLFEKSDGRSNRLWTPRDHCRSDHLSDDPATLAAIVDASVAAWSSRFSNGIVELSGGLDSAIVAASLRQVEQGGLDAFTFFSRSLSGDERRFSRAVAERLGLSSHEIEFDASPMEESLLDGAAIGIRPGIGSTTFFHDRQLADIGSVRGADALFTGRGGDALFFQHPTLRVASGAWPRGLSKSLETLEALARWCQTSVWSAAIAAYLPATMTLSSRLLQSQFCIGPTSARASRWAGPLGGVSPGKRMQIEAIAGERNAFGPSRCAQSLRVIHPLLSQPIVEFAIGQPLMALTQGRRDRAMARAAFADRLPPTLLERRGKGALSYFFGQTLAKSAAFLRTRLLEGALAEARLVDRERLEQALDPEFLMQSNCYGEIIRLLIVERWMRGWNERLRRSADRGAPDPPDFPAGIRSPAHKNPANLQDCL